MREWEREKDKVEERNLDMHHDDIDRHADHYRHNDYESDGN